MKSVPKRIGANEMTISCRFHQFLDNPLTRSSVLPAGHSRQVYMVINQEFVDKILSRSRELFNFRGKVKYYPGRELAKEKSLLFKSENKFMDYLAGNVPWGAEYYLICQRRSEESFRLKEEELVYRMDDLGKFSLCEYFDQSVDDSKIPIKLDRGQLIKEINYLVKATSKPHQS